MRPELIVLIISTLIFIILIILSILLFWSFWVSSYSDHSENSNYSEYPLILIICRRSVARSMPGMLVFQQGSLLQVFVYLSFTFLNLCFSIFVFVNGLSLTQGCPCWPGLPFCGWLCRYLQVIDDLIKYAGLISSCKICRLWAEDVCQGGGWGDGGMQPAGKQLLYSFVSD